MYQRYSETNKASFTLSICLLLFVVRDCIRVVLGNFNWNSDGWCFERYTGPIMTLLAFSSIVALIVYLLSYVRIQLPSRLRYVIVLITVLSVFWTAHSILNVPNYHIGTLDGTAKTVWVGVLGIYLGYDKFSWERIKKSIPTFAMLYMTISFVYVVYIKIAGMWHQQTNEAPYWMTYSTGIWLMAYMVLCYDNSTQRDNRRFLALFLMNAFIVAFSISRGWLLQTVFLTIVYLLTSSSSSSNKRRMVICLLIIMVVGTYILKDDISLYISSYMMKFQSLSSRETQYNAFFSQVQLTDLIMGKGEYASYTYRGNSNYIYIDNSFLYYAFHFGSVFSLSIFLLLLFEATRVLKVSNTVQERKIGIILLMWIAALSGVSVFCAGYEVSFRVLFIMMLVGRAAFISDQSKLKDGAIVKT